MPKACLIWARWAASKPLRRSPTTLRPARRLFWALAVLVHGVANLAIVLTAQVAPVLVAELVLVALVAAFWWWYVWPSRSRFPEQVGPEPVARG